MKKFIAALSGSALIFLLSVIAQAGSATWDLNPGSGDWNTATNWTPVTVPNGSGDTATFALSNITSVSISANTEVNGTAFTSAATNSYTIMASPGLTLTFSGTGITNNSGVTQHFVTAVDPSGDSGTIIFSNNATAGTKAFFANAGSSNPFASKGGETIFKDKSTAGSAFISNEFSNYVGGQTLFLNRSTAGSARLVNESAETQFFGGSTAGSANIFNTGFGVTQFFNSSTAGSATIDNDFGITEFFDSSTAGSATITSTDVGHISFSGRSTAGSANIVTSAQIFFEESSSAGSATIQIVSSEFFFDGSSRGGTAAIILFTGGSEEPPFLDIRFHNAPGLAIGSIEGDANSFVFLGANNLTVGSNNLSTTFAGMIQDGLSFGVGGSLTKIGSGTLDLTGANSYTGNTNINGGVLKVDGSITSNTFVNHGGTLAGTGTINGNVTNNGTVSPGDAPGTLTVASYTQASNGRLLIDIAGASNGQFGVLDVLGNANLNGFLQPVLLNGFTPTIGESFTFLDYASVMGAFSGIQNQVFDNGMERWVVTYQGTDAVLTATKNVPDQGSTLVLLTLSLLGLVTYRQKCWQ
jgi:autotransporter-associated beta strand protein